MSFQSTALIARKSIRARIGRLIAISIAILVGVSFVVGSFVLADSLRQTFDDLFTQISQNVDARVRATVAFGEDDVNVQREPIPASLGEQISQVDGVKAIEPVLSRYAQLVDQDGQAIKTQGAPTLGVAWTGNQELSGLVIKGEGTPPSGPDQVAIDKATADREDFVVGDQIQVITDTGTGTYTITALVGLGDSDGFAGATLAAWDVATAQQVFGTPDQYDGVDVEVQEGADPATVNAAIEAILPPGTELVTRDVIIEESKQGLDSIISVFGSGLLAFAFITAFVSAFLINNVFQITIGQRLRELALMRAVGATGKQVRRLIYTEALVMAVVATALGIGGGILVARVLIIVFNSAGAGFPDTGTVLLPRTILMAILVGVGITLLSVIVPARRAAKIPPVAAMRPELGFEALSTRRLVVGTITTIVGAVAFVVGLFVRPGGTVGTLSLAGLGALLIFLGVASVSSTVARPVTKALGWPIAKVFKTPGVLARENAGRAPRRTSATAAALMIGVSLVSAAAVFASSLRSTFADVLENSLKADYIVTDDSFQGLPPAVATALAQVPELSAVTAVRGAQALVDGDEKAIGAVDPLAFEQLVDIGLEDGSFQAMADGGIMVQQDPAKDLDLAVGDEVTLTFQTGTEVTLPVAGIYEDATLAGNWLISLDTLTQALPTTSSRDFLVVGKLAEGVTPEAADAAVKAAMAPFPQADVQTNAEFRKSQEQQINTLLLIITALLAFSIVIAVLGISITLALGVFERTREIGLMRAVGMNKRQTRRTVRWEAIIVSTFGAVVGIVVGSLIGIALSLAVPDTVIDRIAFSPLMIVGILIGAVVAGFIAALYPSYKASNMNVLQAIASE
ncbi:MAG: FtsX-like permease family protein [Ilumatobacteraceae bacterium]